MKLKSPADLRKSFLARMDEAGGALSLKAEPEWLPVCKAFARIVKVAEISESQRPESPV